MKWAVRLERLSGDDASLKEFDGCAIRVIPLARRVCGRPSVVLCCSARKSTLVERHSGSPTSAWTKIQSSKARPTCNADDG